MQYIEREDYQGHDPYDALNSPVFKLPVFRSNSTIRFVSQQLLKRLVFNPRRLLGIPKQTNPVTLGLCIKAYSHLIESGVQTRELLESKIETLFARLLSLRSQGFTSLCWGYDFPWQARHMYVPAYGPTIVATGIITDALFTAHRVTGKQIYLDACVASVPFVTNDLQRSYESTDELCFSYSPFDNQKVLNASMKAARLLAQVHSVTTQNELAELARRAVRFVSRHQRDDGAWVYSIRKTGGWVDNFHTGYVLDCLHDYTRYTGDESFTDSMKRGFEFYQQNFFEADGKPKYYNTETFPIDCTSAAQSILTLTRFSNVELAQSVAEWMIQNMFDEEGYFYYRRHKNFTSRASYMRWSQAWMLAALAKLSSAGIKKNENQVTEVTGTIAM